MGDVARKIAGTHIEMPENQPALAAWVQQQCRDGAFSSFIKEWVERQPEPLLVEDLVVDDVSAHFAHCRIPTMIADSESVKPFRVDVSFWFSPDGFIRRDESLLQ